MDRNRASTPQLPWDSLVHPGIHFGRVVMRFVKVEGVSSRLTPFFCTASHSHACHSGTRDFQELRVYSPSSLGLSSTPGIPFWSRCHVFRGISVSTRLNPSFCTAFHSHACHSGTRDFQEWRVYSLTPLGLSSAPRIPFWPRCHVFGGSSGREYQAPRLF